MPPVTITLLGGFAAAVDGEPVPEPAWRLRKARELVKLLALAPDGRLHREQAMEALWPDREPAAAANNLYQVVHVARRALGAEAIVVREESLSLEAEVDVPRFEAAAAHARRARTPAAFRAALALYGGPLLPENRYDDWAAGRRDELERARDELSRALAALGPDDGLRPLPADASSFVGRERELGQLRGLLGETRMLTLVGPGGAGKSRLGLELAREAEAEGAVLVELAAIADPGLVEGAAAAALEVQALPDRPLVDAVVDFLAPRRLLLVLDNCEHVLGASAVLADGLLRAAPMLRIVATSREPLRVPGEVVFRVPSLTIPDPEQPCLPADLRRYEAVRLFVERAAAAAPGFVLDEGNAADVARICFRLDGLPLALELAAGRLGALSPASIAERLDDRFRLLRAGSRAAPTRQQTLAATLQWSHDLLAPDERVLYRRLAAFGSGFDLDAAEVVCAGDGLDGPEVADTLGRLVEKSLVVADQLGGERRYRLLETVRADARGRLDAAGEGPALADRHAAWALALAEREGGSPRLDREGPNLRTALDTLTARAPTDALRLCVALRPFWLRRIDLAEAERRFATALERAPERTALRAAALLGSASIDFRAGTLARGRGRVQAEESYAIAVEIADPRAQWQALLCLGELGVGHDAADRAEHWLERGLALARREGFRAAEALCVYSLGVTRWIMGDLAGAEARLAQSAEAFRALAGSAERITSPLNIAEMRSELARDRPGLRIVFEETLQPYVEISCAAAVGYVLANWAGVARARGDLPRATELLEEAAAQFTDEGDRRGQADVLGRRAYLELEQGAVDSARERLRAALALRRGLDDRRGVGLALAGLGRVETAAGAYDAAGRHLAEARDLFRRAGDRWGLASTLWRTADLAFACNRVDDAEAALLEARAALGETDRERWIAHTVAGLAEVALLRGDAESAAARFAEARERYAATGDGLGTNAVDERLRSLQSAG